MKTPSKFGRISDIVPSQPETWQDRWFVTIDTDWCSDEVLLDTKNLISSYNIPVTWFLTHSTPVLTPLDSDLKVNQSNSEIGAHPNFNALIIPDHPGQRTDALAILRDSRDIVPTALSVRSHSLTCSQWLSILFAENGFSHASNYLIPFESKVAIEPFMLQPGITEVPIGWMDSLHVQSSSPLSISDICGLRGLRVLDFHPVHLYLNTEDIARYTQAKPLLRSPDLARFRNTRIYGIRDLFDELLNRLAG